jgi:hypothetical protein
MKSLPTVIRIVLAIIVVFTAAISDARQCDLGASDLIFVVQASYDLPNDDFESIKSFVGDMVTDLDVGTGPNVSTT